jgi:hypothetical protein
VHEGLPPAAIGGASFEKMDSPASACYPQFSACPASLTRRRGKMELGQPARPLPVGLYGKPPHADSKSRVSMH